MSKPKPTHEDFDAVVRNVLQEKAFPDFLIEGMFLAGIVEGRIEGAFSRRTIRKQDIRPAVLAAIQRVHATGRIRMFRIWGFGDSQLIYEAFALVTLTVQT
jgi:hypothetical protein